MVSRQRMAFFFVTSILVVLAAPSIPFFNSNIDKSAMGQESSSSGDINNTSSANENTRDEVLNDTFQVLPDASPPLILDGSLKVEKVIEGLRSPTSMVFLDHDSLLILEKNGNVRYVSDGVLQPNPI